MFRRIPVFGSVAARALTIIFSVALAVSVASTAYAGSYTKRGVATRVIDGDTLVVDFDRGPSERVRLIGIDTPETGQCYGARATLRARAIAAGRRVVVRGDPTQRVRDRYGRLLGYVGIRGGVDLGRRLILGGYGKVYVYERPFERVSSYREAQRVARRESRGLWRACGGSSGGGTRPRCHPSYSPCLPIVGDLDCDDVRAMGRDPVRVTGSDPYRLDGDGDGWGCE